MAFTFTMDQQDAGNWCWLAVATSVARHFGSAVHRQCNLAQALVPGLPPSTACCASTTPTACDAQQNPSIALAHVGHSSGSIGGLAPFGRLQSEIAQGRPVAMSFVYAHSGASHVLVVTDAFVRSGAQMLTIDDPDPVYWGARAIKYGSSPRLTLATSWVRTYFTKP